jgi:hypothetical protein
MNKLPKEYYRFQSIMDENLALDSYAKEDIEKLFKYGEQIIKERKDDIHTSLNGIIAEKIGSRYSC